MEPWLAQEISFKDVKKSYWPQTFEKQCRLNYSYDGLCSSNLNDTVAACVVNSIETVSFSQIMTTSNMLTKGSRIKSECD